MKTGEKIREKKLHYDISKDAAKISAVSSSKINRNILQVRKYFNSRSK